MTARSTPRKKATRKKAARRKKGRTKPRKSPQAAHKRTPGSLLPDRVAPEGGGKPKVKIDGQELRRMSMLGLGQRDIAALLRISRRTLEVRLAEDPDLLEMMELGKAEMRRNIRAAQLSGALAGNATLLIWLGKTECGQRETVRFGLEQDDPDEMRPFLQRRLTDFIKMTRKTNGGGGLQDVGDVGLPGAEGS